MEDENVRVREKNLTPNSMSAETYTFSIIIKKGMTADTEAYLMASGYPTDGNLPWYFGKPLDDGKLVYDAKVTVTGKNAVLSIGPSFEKRYRMRLKRFEPPAKEFVVVVPILTDLYNYYTKIPLIVKTHLERCQSYLSEDLRKAGDAVLMEKPSEFSYPLIPLKYPLSVMIMNTNSADVFVINVSVEVMINVTLSKTLAKVTSCNLSRIIEIPMRGFGTHMVLFESETLPAANCSPEMVLDLLEYFFGGKACDKIKVVDSAVTYDGHHIVMN